MVPLPPLAPSTISPWALGRSSLMSALARISSEITEPGPRGASSSASASSASAEGAFQVVLFPAAVRRVEVLLGAVEELVERIVVVCHLDSPLNVQEPDVAGVLLDELLAGLHLVAHELAHHTLGLGRIVDVHLQKRCASRAPSWSPTAGRGPSRQGPCSAGRRTCPDCRTRRAPIRARSRRRCSARSWGCASSSSSSRRWGGCAM